ncbi:metal-dependent hydrolase [Nocardia halotolerans]|uniref:Metal-dependent hydrolase n=1 Tax=Nocardia halotolerans TaxID=1755878 RepID=A0ABV8V9J6_9NOCA
MKLLRGGTEHPDVDPGTVALHARNVAFDWSGVALQWMPAEPLAGHLISALNMLLPEGERMFIATYREALPFVRDDKLREDMLGFIGQESMHAETHAKVLVDVLAEHGIDTGPYERLMEYLFRTTLGPRGDRTGQVLVERLAFIACLEHFFAWLGDWVLNADLEKFGADPRMADLFRWHGAEEVEHRNVAHDVAEYFGVGYVRRCAAMTLVFPIFLVLLLRGTRYLVHQDPQLPDHGYPRLLTGVFGAMWRGALPGVPSLLRSALSTFKPGYNPQSVGSTAQAVAYLAASPGARAAAS